MKTIKEQYIIDKSKIDSKDKSQIDWLRQYEKEDNEDEFWIYNVINGMCSDFIYIDPYIFEVWGWYYPSR